jgi:hypothetical protein
MEAHFYKLWAKKEARPAIQFSRENALSSPALVSVRKRRELAIT